MTRARTFLVFSLIVAGAVLLSGCTAQPAAVAGVITGPERSMVGHQAPDIPVVTAEGKETSLGKIRQPVTIVAFVAPADGQCCKLDASLVALGARLRDEPITVVQISEPAGKCPHGSTCIARCHFQAPHLVSLCDVDRIAWNTYRRPQPDTVLLIDSRGKVAQVARLTDLGTVAAQARRYAAETGGWWQAIYGQ